MVGVSQRVWVLVRWVLVVCVVGVAVSLPAQEAKTTLVMPPTPLLPQHFGPWVMDGNATTGNDGAQVDAPNAASLKDYGLERFSVAQYSAGHDSGHGGGTIEVKALQFVDATGAAGGFTFYQRPELRGLAAGQKLGANAAVAGDEALFWSGNTLVITTAKQGHAALVNDLKELEAGLPKIGGPKGAPPLLPTLVPTKGLEAGSVKYALGPTSYTAMGGILPSEILGWDKSAEVATAKYAGGGVLTLLLYPTPQIAGDRGRAIEASINANRSAFGAVRLRREGPLLVLATGGFSPAQEGELVQGIHLPVQLTWDKKMPLEFHAEVQKTYSLLESIAIFCGLGALAAVILGVFLGGARAGIRVLQGKPAASEPEFLRIDLRGQSAPLHMDSRAEEPKG
jgi:hypothetical protein